MLLLCTQGLGCRQEGGQKHTLTPASFRWKALGMQVHPGCVCTDALCANDINAHPVASAQVQVALVLVAGIYGGPEMVLMGGIPAGGHGIAGRSDAVLLLSVASLLYP